MKRLTHFILGFILAPYVAAAALPLKVDGLKSLGDVSITGSQTTSGSASIGTSSAANSKAVLDLVSTTKGFLPPRMTEAQRDAIATPPTGLVIFNTTSNALNSYDGAAWVEVGSGAGGSSGAQYNLLTNYGFEDATYSTDWTASGGTLAAATSTNILFNTQGATWDSNGSSQTLSYATIAIPQGYKGNTCEASAYFQVPSGTATHLVQAYDGTNILSSATISNGTTPVKTTVTFPCPTSGNLIFRVVSVAADEPLIAIDNAYLGLATNVGLAMDVTPWQSFTPSLNNSTNVSSNAAYYRRVGDSIEVSGYLAYSGAGSGAQLTISIPSELTMDTTKVNSATNELTAFGTFNYLDAGTGYRMGSVVYATSTTVSLNADSSGGPYANTQFANNDKISYRFVVPITGFRPQATATIESISKRGSILWSGSATGSITAGSKTTFNDATYGTYTAEGQALAPTTSNDLGIRLANAPAGVYEVTATGSFYAYKSTTNTATTCYFDLYDGTNASGSMVTGAVGIASVAAIDGSGTLTGTFSLASTGTINVVLRGQRSGGDGTCYAQGPVQLSIKNVSQNSPAIIILNSVTTSTQNGDRQERARIPSGCASITSQSGDGISSVSSPGTGQCTVNFTAGKFSSAPSCFCTVIGERYCRQNAAATTSSVTFDIYNGSSPPILANSAIDVFCVGPR